MRTNLSLLLGGVAIVCLFSGCDSNSGRLAIDGSVLYAGEPIKKGSIIFQSPDPASPEVSAAIVDGAYKVPAQLGPKAEEYVVKIEAFRMKKSANTNLPDYLKNDPNAGMIPEQYVPKKYNDNSQLKVKFDAAKTTYDFALEK
jgi:hypothetical protein